MNFSSDIENNEYKLLQRVLLFSAMFWFLGILKGLFFNGHQTIIVLDFISFTIAAILIIAKYRKVNSELITKMYCLTWLPMYILYWKFYGGIEGSMTYMFFTVLLIFLGLLTGRARLFMAIIFCLINMILTLDAEAQLLMSIEPTEKLLNPLSINYLFHVSVVAALVVFIKVKFDEEREDIEGQNQNLNQLNLDLSKKNELLGNQQVQIKRIQNNLEELVHEHTTKLEQRNRELKSYAYDNAHVVRRPLSNILSLLEILNVEMEEEKEQLSNIRKNAQDLDNVVRKINTILH